ncbi:uncharacterized protein TNCV_5119091 [Trichonephila clavipes]|nr:uncharacterized protein TNCV_5119091 [Trichonephila clavipes]
MPMLFNACIKLGVVIDVSPYLVPHLQRIPAEDVLGYALLHPESSVRDISKACSYSKSTLSDFLEHEVSLRDLSRMWYQHDGAPAQKSVQPCTFLAQTFDTRIICYGGQQEVEEATDGVSDAGLVLHFCGRQSF